MREFDEKYKKRILLVLMAICVVLIIQTGRLNGPVDKRVEFMNIKIMSTNLKGVYQSIICLIALLMVCIDYKRGRVLAIIAVGYGLVMTGITIFVKGEYSPLPGFINTALSICSIIIISVFFEKAYKRRYSDDLTGLLNRAGLLREINRAIEKNRLRNVIFVRLKNFRAISDNLGHEYGDKALKIVADRMREVVAEDGVICRVDGTEYAIAITGYVDEKKLCQTLIDSISEKLTITKDDTAVNCYITAFAGIATYPDDAKDGTTLMKYADIAVYNEVNNNKTKIKYGYFKKEMLESMARKTDVIKIIKDSIENDYFYLVYQPQYEIKTKRLRGFETLLRCKLPDGTFVSPGEFIPVAETSDLIYKIDDYVLERAMREFEGVLKAAKGRYILSINVSAKSMADKNFVDKIAEMLEKTGFPASELEIEITEYSFEESMEQTTNNVQLLRKLGVKIALDDFGTGYTSLSQLVNLPVNLLKIDKSLIDDVETKSVSRDIINSVIYMGHLMNCEVISEGVEEESQLEILKEYNCDFVQGFVWSKPISYDEAKALVK